MRIVRGLGAENIGDRSPPAANAAGRFFSG
jgi:hypothetical protein